jgi:hypothetical protein
MGKFDSVVGQELLAVDEGDNELTLVFKDNRFLFIRVEDGRLVAEAVP